MTQTDGPTARVLAASRQLHHDHRFTVAIWVAFLLGVGLMYDALFHDFVPFGGPVGWLLAAGATVVYVQVEFQAALGTLRLHPEYESISVSMKIKLWTYLMQSEYWLFGIVAFGLIWVGLVGFVFVHPYVFVAVVTYASVVTVLSVGKFFVLTEEEFEAEMGGVLSRKG